MFNAFILGLVQGLTEFLPVSSSGHLTFFEDLLQFEGNKSGFTAAIHLATFLSVTLYFHKDIIAIIKSLLIQKEQDKTKKELAVHIITATIPGVILAFIVDKIAFFQGISTNLTVIGITSIVFSLLLYFADKKSRAEISEKTPSFVESIFIGASQVLAAAFAGASRSGVTLTTSYFMGINRTYATRFVFLISIPITGLAAIYEIVIKKA